MTDSAKVDFIRRIPPSGVSVNDVLTERGTVLNCPEGGLDREPKA